MTATRRQSAVLILALLAAVLIPTSADAKNFVGSVRVSGVMSDFGSVSEWKVSPDGTRLVFRADREVDGRLDLWSVPLDGVSEPVKLVTATAFIGGFDISPNSTRVVFTGQLGNPDDGMEIYSVPIDGSAPHLRLNDLPGPSGGGIEHLFEISPDSARVVYRGSLTQLGKYDVYSAPIDAAGGQVQLNYTAAHGYNVSPGYQITSDSAWVVFRADLDVDNQYALYAKQITGGPATIVLSETAVPGASVEWFELVPGHHRVVYLGELLVDNRREVFSRSFAPMGAQIRLNDTPVTGGGVSLAYLAPSGARVVFTGDLVTDGQSEVYSAPVTSAGGQIRLSAAASGGKMAHAVKALAPDGSRVVFSGSFDEINSHLYTAPVDQSGGQVRITTAPSQPPSGNGGLWAVVAPNSQRVVFWHDRGAPDVFELYGAPIATAGGQVTLTDPPVEGGDVTSWQVLTANFEILPDSSKVVFTGDLATDEVVELWSAPLDGTGPQVRLNDPLPANARVRDFVIAPDGSFVVYAADQVTAGKIELWATSRGDAPTPPTALSVDDVTATSVTLSWQAPAGIDVADYVVEVNPTVTTTATSATVTGLEPETAYTATVRARNGAGTSLPASVTFRTTTVSGLHRLFGNDRYATAAAVALDRFLPDDVETVFLATGTNFPDALAGGPLAAHHDAPILLVEPTALPAATADALATLAPATVVALGGTSAVSDDVLVQAAGAAGGATPDRVAGPDRYATAAAIAARLPATDAVFLAVGTNFPDALAGGPASGGAPILLTTPGTLPAATTTALTERTPQSIVALGGTAVIGDAVLAEAAGAAGAAATARIAGPDRYATALGIADTLGTPDTVYVAVGTNFPDALAAGSAATAEGAPIVLTPRDMLPLDVLTWLQDLPGLRRIVILGGAAAVSPEAEDVLRSLVD